MIALGFCAALFFGAWSLLRASGIVVGAETLQQMRDYVLGMGALAWLLFVFVGTFRVFFFIPSWILLAVGGMAFGSQLGALLGTIGITLSAVLGFGIARYGSKTFIAQYLSERFGDAQARLADAGILLLGLTTAHPMVPMSGLHWAAGMTALPLVGFTVAVGVGAAVRATALAFLGAQVQELGLWVTLAIGLALGVVGALPFVHPALRARLLGRS